MTPSAPKSHTPVSRPTACLVAACIGLLVMAQSVVLAMPADAQRPDNAASASIGRGVAERHCAACHAIGRRGQSPNPRAPRFPLIAERYPNDNPAGVLIDGTVVRHPGMPEFRMLEEDTDGLVAYIRRISRRWNGRR